MKPLNPATETTVWRSASRIPKLSLAFLLVVGAAQPRLLADDPVNRTFLIRNDSKLTLYGAVQVVWPDPDTKPRILSLGGDAGTSTSRASSSASSSRGSVSNTATGSLNASEASRDPKGSNSFFTLAAKKQGTTDGVQVTFAVPAGTLNRPGKGQLRILISTKPMTDTGDKQVSAVLLDASSNASGEGGMVFAWMVPLKKNPKAPPISNIAFDVDTKDKACPVLVLKDKS